MAVGIESTQINPYLASFVSTYARMRPLSTWHSAVKRRASVLRGTWLATTDSNGPHGLPRHPLPCTPDEFPSGETVKTAPCFGPPHVPAWPSQLHPARSCFQKARFQSRAGEIRLNEGGKRTSGLRHAQAHVQVRPHGTVHIMAHLQLSQGAIAQIFDGQTDARPALQVVGKEKFAAKTSNEACVGLAAY